jgi:hypothetical protein
MFMRHVEHEVDLTEWELGVDLSKREKKEISEAIHETLRDQVWLTLPAGFTDTKTTNPLTIYLDLALSKEEGDAEPRFESSIQELIEYIIDMHAWNGGEYEGKVDQEGAVILTRIRDALADVMQRITKTIDEASPD